MEDKYLNRFRYALCNGQIMCIEDVTKEIRKSSTFTCIGCSHEMSAALGDVREHYFRHKNNENCSHESYLHNLAKRKLKELFDSQEHFYILYKAVNSCNLLGICKAHRCDKLFLQPIDLKEYYDTCEIEKTCNMFRADVLLSHSEYPNRKLLLEIHVSNSCSPEKLASGLKIIEIDVSSEDTVIYPFDEQRPNMHFHNFKFKREIVPSRKLKRFSFLTNEDNNKAFNVDTIDCTEQDNHIDNAEFDIVLKKTSDKISLEYLGLAQAMILGTTIRHCNFCENCYRCTVPIQQRVIDKRDGKEKLIQQRVSPLQLSDQDKWSAARNCANYVGNRRGCFKLVKEFGESNFILWNRNQNK